MAVGIKKLVWCSYQIVRSFIYCAGYGETEHTLYILIFVLVLGLIRCIFYVLSSRVLSFVCLAFYLLCCVSYNYVQT